jgi:small subunit ribosomal protein S8
MLRIMQDAGYIRSFEFVDDGRGGQLVVRLTGRINNCGAITPRFSVQSHEMEYWEKQYLPGKNFGLLILSTSYGVMSHEQARKDGIGGELLGYVY